MVVLFGSGETSADAQPIHDYALRRVTPPVRAAVVETPAGFEINSAAVAGRLAEFLRVRLQNYRPRVTVVPARARGTSFSPDDPDVVAPLFDANYIMMGPGSPSYAVRQLRDSVAWHAIAARHRQGNPLVLASAATIAMGTFALPVYEIYKVGEDLHWKPGLDLFGPYGLSVAFVPHWDNTDGGEELDTSHCFMGRPRFGALCSLLPPATTLVGISEHTALVIDFQEECARVMGAGQVTVIRDGQERAFARRESFSLTDLGITRVPAPSEGIPPAVLERIASAEAAAQEAPQPSEEVLALVAARAKARSDRDWQTADRLRLEIAALGWQVNDAPGGAQVVPVAPPAD
jgi:cyanophycinase-like exopeptidase